MREGEEVLLERRGTDGPQSQCAAHDMQVVLSSPLSHLGVHRPESGQQLCEHPPHQGLVQQRAPLVDEPLLKSLKTR